MRDAAHWAGEKTDVSTDLDPLSYQKALIASLKELDERDIAPLIPLLAAMGLIGLSWFNPRKRPDSYVIGTSGFAGLSLQLVLMFAYQSAVGGLYRDLALLNGAFMVAAALGAMSGRKLRLGRLQVFAIEVGQLVLSLALWGGMTSILSADGHLAKAGIVLGSVLVGFATGIQVAAVSAASGKGDGKAGGVYAIDIAGAAIAAALTYTVLVPALGLGGTCLFVAGVKGSSMIVAGILLKDDSRVLDSPRAPIWLTCLVGLLAIAVASSSHGWIYLWTLGRSYFGVVIGVMAMSLAAGLAPTLWKRLDRVKVWNMNPQRALSFLLLLPLAVVPLARCYFKIPYIFCHNCPRPCAFGIARPYIVTSALLANVGDHRFCERVCPLGMAQKDAGAKGEGTLRRLGVGGMGFRIAVILLVIWFYFGDFAGMQQGGYVTSAVVLVVAGGILALSFRVRRPFCEGVCPIGGVSNLVTKGLNRKARAEGKAADE